ncbi:hypothetical protein BS47DRAFT_1363933 [Hydnum rufescens UP504]|uniref:Uncharacterized protein n=1 Tax=Hydnum rufescens UP504 TaxID=1448309 RepID=A0A9P6ATA1_9AGAM|nr:hypothetical protein BS47DRAFT_1363933 [Hydnum rufescens UP504]
MSIWPGISLGSKGMSSEIAEWHKINGVLRLAMISSKSSACVYNTCDHTGACPNWQGQVWSSVGIWGLGPCTWSSAAMHWEGCLGAGLLGGCTHHGFSDSKGVIWKNGEQYVGDAQGLGLQMKWLDTSIFCHSSCPLSHQPKVAAIWGWALGQGLGWLGTSILHPRSFPYGPQTWGIINIQPITGNKIVTDQGGEGFHILKLAQCQQEYMGDEVQVTSW